MNNDGAMVAAEMNSMRFVIRVLQLHANGKTSEAEFTEILSLPNHRDTINKYNP
jgi:hypothetical protein